MKQYHVQSEDTKGIFLLYFSAVKGEAIELTNCFFNGQTVVSISSKNDSGSENERNSCCSIPSENCAQSWTTA
jgi:hypothetical protein